MKKIQIILMGMILIQFLSLDQVYSQLTDEEEASLNEKFYDFRIDRVTEFFPSNSYQVLQEKFGNGILYNRSEENVELRRYDIKDGRFTLVIFIQIYQAIVIDTHIIFPSYFLHNSLLQSLIKEFGKNDFYWHDDQTSIYQWKNVQESKLSYVGGCTIYCFPIYISAIYLKEYPELEEFRPLLHQMNGIQKED